MLRKFIKFTDLDGNEQEEEFYFHLTKAELIKAEVSQEGGLQKHLLEVVKTGNPGKILAAFEEIIRMSYGRRIDGRFVKRPEDWEDFLTSEAYSALFMELVTDATYASQFIKGIMPGDIDPAEVAAVASSMELETLDLPQPELALEATDALPDWEREMREPTDAELQTMDKTQLFRAMRFKMSGSYDA